MDLYNRVEKILKENFLGEYYYFIYTKGKSPLLGSENLESELKEIFSEENFIEGRIFNENYEVRIFYDGKNFQSILIDTKEMNEKEKIKREYIINKALKNSFKKVEIIEYLEKDKDGEYRIKSTSLNRLIKEW